MESASPFRRQHQSSPNSIRHSNKIHHFRRMHIIRAMCAVEWRWHARIWPYVDEQFYRSTASPILAGPPKSGRVLKRSPKGNNANDHCPSCELKCVYQINTRSISPTATNFVWIFECRCVRARFRLCRTEMRET